jgi:hypothetical protein
MRHEFQRAIGRRQETETGWQVPGNGRRNSAKKFRSYLNWMGYSVFAMQGQGLPDNASPVMPLTGGSENCDSIPGNSW